jgi:hypothetical protein
MLKTEGKMHDFQRSLPVPFEDDQVLKSRKNLNWGFAGIRSRMYAKTP